MTSVEFTKSGRLRVLLKADIRSRDQGILYAESEGIFVSSKACSESEVAAKKLVRKEEIEIKPKL